MYRELDKLRDLLQSPERSLVIKQVASLWLAGITLDDFAKAYGFLPYLAGIGAFENKGDKAVMEGLRLQMEADTSQVRLPFIEPFAAELWFRGVTRKQFLATVKVQDPAKDASYNVHTAVA